jgi:hypothetical protein
MSINGSPESPEKQSFSQSTAFSLTLGSKRPVICILPMG